MFQVECHCGLLPLVLEDINDFKPADALADGHQHPCVKKMMEFVKKEKKAQDKENGVVSNRV